MIRVEYPRCYLVSKIVRYREHQILSANNLHWTAGRVWPLAACGCRLAPAKPRWRYAGVRIQEEPPAHSHDKPHTRHRVRAPEQGTHQLPPTTNTDFTGQAAVTSHLPHQTHPVCLMSKTFNIRYLQAIAYQHRPIWKSLVTAEAPARQHFCLVPGELSTSI